MTPFHLAFPVHDLAAARSFYAGLLACPVGRSAPDWIDFDLYGNQIVAHLDRAMAPRTYTNEVDGDAVPVPHFGTVLPWEEFHALAGRLRAAGIIFEIAPHIRFQGEVGEQATMFFRDPSGNALEFKSFRDPTQLFAA
jgi:extradiol dioxygenase family protein